MHRSALALVFAVLALAAPPALSASIGATARTSAITAPLVDFNGDATADLAVGSPGEDLGNIADAGAVTVRTSGQGWQTFTENSAAAGGGAEPGDHFGGSSAAGDFNDDGFTDLAVGSPTEDVGAAVDAGAVTVLYGSASGLSSSGSQVFTQDTTGVGSSAERGDLFGFALTSADFNNDGRADLAIGVKREDAFVIDAGALNILYGTPTGLSGSGSQIFTEKLGGTGGLEQPADMFGSALAAGDFDDDGFADLGVGIPHKDVGGVNDAGAVTILRGSASGLTGTGIPPFSQNTPGVPGSNEIGDGFGTALATGDWGGDGFADLAVGVPGEDVIVATNAGSAYVLHGSPGGLSGTGSQLFTQNSPGYDDKPEARDYFGSALEAVDFYDVGDELAVGVPGEDVGPAMDAGMVQIGGSQVTENTPGMAGTAEPGDRLGASLANLAGKPAVLAVGVPGEDGRSGAVLIVTGILDDGDQLPPSGAVVDQDSPGIPGTSEIRDFFGAALTGS